MQLNLWTSFNRRLDIAINIRHAHAFDQLLAMHFTCGIRLLAYICGSYSLVESSCYPAKCFTVVAASNPNRKFEIRDNDDKIISTKKVNAFATTVDLVSSAKINKVQLPYDPRTYLWRSVLCPFLSWQRLDPIGYPTHHRLVTWKSGDFLRFLIGHWTPIMQYDWI